MDLETLEFEIADLQTYEQLMGGRTTGEILLRMGTLDVTGTVHGLYAGRVRREPGLTVDDVRDELTAYLKAGGNMLTVAKAIERAIQRSPVFQRLPGVALEAPRPRSAPPAPRRKRG